MTEPIPFKYRAFLSYSHADTRWAKHLHRRLEAFRIDKDLTGRETSQGPNPKTLRPIFRDRDDFTAGHTLTDQTVAALDASAALIVLCSPASAKSHYVNEEIRLFKSRHPERPVVPVIADGTPGDAEHECFPPALRFAVSTDGIVTGTPDIELAADLRESGDGPDLALAKVVARLLDLSTDDVFRRAERARRRSARIRNGIIGALALLTVSAISSGAYAWQLLKTNEAFLEATLKRATEIVNTSVAQAEKYGVPRTASLELLTRAEGLFDDMARLGRPTLALQQQKAWMLLQFARNYEILGNTEKQRERIDEALRIMTALAAEWPNDASVLRQLAVVVEDRGDVLRAQGDLATAAKSYQASLALVEMLAKAQPDKVVLRHGLSVSRNKIGNIFVAQGNLPEALKAFQESYNILEALVEAEPDNPRWRRDLSLASDRLGEVRFSQGNLEEALRHFQAGLAQIVLARDRDPGNPDLQRRAARASSRVGDVLYAQGKLPDALRCYQESLAVRERLARGDPSNAQFQYDVGSIQEAIGDVLMAQRDPDAAMASYRASQEVVARLAKADPTNTDWQRFTLVSHIKVGSVLVAQGKLPEALASYRASLAIAETLASAEPGHTARQRDLATAREQVARVL
jgi:tetratricopeptide (TPR) repeat protein